MDSIELFEGAITWLKENYLRFRFFTERDIVWTIHTRIIQVIEQQSLHYRVFHNHPILPRQTTDLAILSQDDSIEIAAEFKYEPAYTRKSADIWHTKFPVVFWEGDGSVARDIERIREFVIKGKAEAAYALLIDEGGHFAAREPFPSSRWLDWGDGISVLWAQVRKSR